MEATIDSHCVAMETGGFDRTIVFMSYCANLYWDKMRVGVFGHPCPVLVRRFLLNANKEARRRKNPPSFPSMPRCRACPWCHNKCIYTATGEHFFLHCYIVTNGAGAKPGERRLLVRKPAAFPHRNQAISALQREDGEVNPVDWTRPGERKGINEPRCQRISPLQPFQDSYQEEPTLGCYQYPGGTESVGP